MKLKEISIGFVTVCLASAMGFACGGSTTKGTADTDGGEIPGLAEGAQEIGVSQMCASCINDNCPSQFEACWADATCKKAEICAGQCIVKNGPGSGITCSSSAACKSDSSLVANLTDCIVGDCATPCGNE